MKSPQLDAAYEKIAFLFKKIQQTTEPPLCRNDIEDTWEHILETNENKAVVSDENTPMAQIAKMYIMEYYTLSLAIGDSAEYAPIQTALRLILVNITNTAFSIYKLAFDGFHNQAHILTRSLYELCLVLICILLDENKRAFFLGATSEENSKKDWHTHFSPKQLQKTLESYDQKIGMVTADKFLKEIYARLSSYAHNDFWSVYRGAYANLEDEEMNHLNLFGAYAYLAEQLLDDVNGILLYTSLHFIKIIDEGKYGITKKQLCARGSDNSPDYTLWDCAMFLNALNQEYGQSMEEIILSEWNHSNITITDDIRNRVKKVVLSGTHF